jgi:hypothetical protein
LLAFCAELRDKYRMIVITLCLKRGFLKKRDCRDCIHVNAADLLFWKKDVPEKD